MIAYFETGKTITGEYYASLLNRLDEEMKKIRPHFAKKKVLFHQDNAPAHKSMVVKFDELGYELHPNPPYSPHLGPCNFTSSQIGKNGSPEKDVNQMKKLNGKLTHFSGQRRNSFSSTV